MSKLEEDYVINIKVDVNDTYKQIVSTRITACWNESCYYNIGSVCQLKKVYIDENGECAYKKVKFND